MIEIKKKKIVISSTKTSRSDWEMSFKKMAKRGDDKLLDTNIQSSSQGDRDNWEWK